MRPEKNADQELFYVGRIKVPYEWTVGAVGSRFFTELRDYGRLLGKKCPDCGVVYIPPRKTCGKCFVDTEEWVEVGPAGTLLTYAVVYRGDPPIPSMRIPYAYAIVKLEGADTGLVHFLGEFEPEQLHSGLRVTAVLREKREGNILDICYFRPIS